MSRIFAIAMVFKKEYAGHIEEDLRLHIITTCETPGDAFLKAFEADKKTLPGAALHQKVIVEMPPTGPVNPNN